MHKIASDGATVDNLFTEGNVALAVPATVVSAAWLNAVQTELVNMITRYGIALNDDDADTATLLYQAIEIAIKLGGRTAPVVQSLINNQAAFADVTDFPTFDVTLVQTVEFLFSVVRKTDSGVLKESGRAYLSYDATNGWEVSRISGFDGGGLTLGVAVVAGNVYKLQYKTTNHAGASYTGFLRMTDIKQIVL